MTIHTSARVGVETIERGYSIEELVAGVSHRDGQSRADNRRTRRRLKSNVMTSATFLALLGAQGCKLVPQALDVTTPNQGPSAPPPAAPAPAAAALEFVSGEQTIFNVEDIYSIAGLPDNADIDIVSIESSVGGTFEIDGHLVVFTPPEGILGDASFTIEYRIDETGPTKVIVPVKIVPPMDDHDGHGSPGEGAGGGEDDDHNDDDHGGDGDGDGGDGGHEDPSHPPGTPHADDPSKMAEHLALLNLVPVDAATHVAVSSGSWFDPATWAGGEVPGDGARVLIPTGITVDYDGESAASIFTIRVDGALEFATDRDTALEVDTFVVSPTGRLEIGEEGNPVDPSVTARITFADNGAIDVNWDPMLLSRGLISHGEIEIHGAEKENAARVRIDPMAGDTSITFESAPEGWRVGDEIVLTGTHLVEVNPSEQNTLESAQTQDEVRIITRIEGSTVYFAEPLVYNHDGARDDLKAYAANLSRNVVFTTENSDDVPVSQRGHVMLMHSDNIDVRYASFDDLGRTDKSVRAFDVTELDVVTSDSNIKARYSLHLHRAGIDDQENPAILIGNSVSGVPGWGIVQHDSNAIINSNVVYDITGAGIVAESGNEIGRWADNIVIRAFGVNHQNKSGDDVIAFDLGRTGVGYWFQSRLVEAVDNIASDIPGGTGFVYFSRGSQDDTIQVTNATAPQPEALGYNESSRIYQAAINTFTGNEAIAVQVGLEVVKPGLRQSHDVRSVLEDFTAWEVEIGAEFQYTGHYTLRDFDLLASDSAFLEGSRKTTGIRYLKSVVDFAVVDSTIDGFYTGFETWKSWPGEDSPPDFWNYLFVDVDIRGATVDYSNPTPSDRFLTASELIERSPSVTLADAEFPVFNGSLVLTGTKYDSAGSTSYGHERDEVVHNFKSVKAAVQEHGYWLTADGKQVTFVEFYVTDRVTGEIGKQSVWIEIDPSYLIDEGRWGDVAYNGLYDADNRAPIVENDAATVRAGESVSIDVLANDSDPDGDQIYIDSFDSDRGHVVINSDGGLTYVADGHWTGEDTIRYWVQDVNGNITEAQLVVTVEI